jgi:hypothetical protein
MKLSVSGKFANLALSIITPPESCLKRNEVKSFAGPSTNCSCAFAETDTVNKKKINICVTGFRITIWQSLQIYPDTERSEVEGPDRSDNCPANRRIVALICCICTTSYNNNPINNYRLQLIE